MKKKNTIKQFAKISTKLKTDQKKKLKGGIVIIDADAL